MTSYENLNSRWNNITSITNSFVRIDAEHPLDWYIGYENHVQKSLLLISDFEPGQTYSSKSIIVSKGLRNDNKWALSFRLVKAEQEDVFIRLVTDLIESSRSQKNDIKGIEFVIRRYSQWSTLMERQREGLLSDNEIKGLIGEVHFLQDLISEGMPVLEAVNGWMGPEGADQDFIYSNGWREIKAVSSGTSAVSISSLEQLNANPPGELVVTFIDKTSPNDNNAFTLNEKILQTQNLLESNYLALDIFKGKLLKYGYIDLPEYNRNFYKIVTGQHYLIKEDFPRLIPNNVPVPIVSVKYQLSLQALDPWKINR